MNEPRQAKITVGEIVKNETGHCQGAKLPQVAVLSTFRACQTNDGKILDSAKIALLVDKNRISLFSGGRDSSGILYARLLVVAPVLNGCAEVVMIIDMLLLISQVCQTSQQFLTAQ
ncbi:MAG TPA: hypothetical protein VNT76_20300, partial [Candidatus Binatus sp.]|nr:hypothetical protein [Candidatus Binatus sp.]